MAIIMRTARPHRFPAVHVVGGRGARLVMIDGREIPGVVSVRVDDCEPDTARAVVTITLETDDVTLTSAAAEDRAITEDGASA